MGAFLFLLSSTCLFYSFASSASFSELVSPPFRASYLQFVDNNGAFLFSRNGTFKAGIFSPGGEQPNFYLCVMHVASSTIIWSANRDSPISNSGLLNLTTGGISISDEDGNKKWSTPTLSSPVSGLLLTEMGNLVLLDRSNQSLWESFQNPTDTIVIGQRLNEGTTLSSSVDGDNLAKGNYELAITDSDMVLQWQGQTYWKLSMETRAFKNSNNLVQYMALNRTGLFLFGLDESQVVFRLILPQSDFQIAQLDFSGQFIISSFSAGETKQEFVGPTDNCRIPVICGSLGLCVPSSTTTPTCLCPPGLSHGSQNLTRCLPTGNSLPLACNSTNNDSHLNYSELSYLRLGYGMDYFALAFSEPTQYGVNLTVCQDSCSSDCSCLGVFYDNSSSSCYTLQNELGSIISESGADDLLGYIKVGDGSGVDDGVIDEDQQLPVIAVVLLPVAGLLLFAALAFLFWRRSKLSKKRELKLRHLNSNSSGDLDHFYIPGLPQRFDYAELEEATNNFGNQIGSGGFGSVYKGILRDKSVVAVKKLTNLGIQGKQDFCTEIAVIGNVHHVNLVKLRGFCAQRGQRLLVYEYMNRGSLDKTLFGGGPVLEWQERYEIALGTARGLAYLHAGCEKKIIHCDVKPENILLHEQFQAKISDFGLSKLLTPEQSSLFTTMRGTRGYLAPEWLTNSAISEKTDVYSFGMVLLELVSGRKNCSIRSQSHSMDCSSSGCSESTPSSTSGLMYFPLFALEMHEQGKYLDLADPRLEGRVTGEEVGKVVRVALCCVHEEPILRPSMVNAVAMLEGRIPVGQPRIESLNFLRFYGRRFTESSMIQEGNEGSTLMMMYPETHTSATSTTSDSHACFSYISSQQVSGPR